jgi:hypothetical protein
VAGAVRAHVLVAVGCAALERELLLGLLLRQNE